MNEQDYIKIHKYLERELTTEESQEVANLIANNSEWKQAYAEAKLVIDTAEVHGATALRGQLDGIHQDLFGEEKEAKVVEMPRRQWLKIAASIVLPVAIGLGILFNQGNSLNQTLAANYNPLEEVNNTVRGAGDGQENPVKEALADEDWALAAELLENQAEPL
ncbi:MAG TPA: hypothetical protein DCE41_33255, partial [Cytophagales bacterium]|nr:hypothetical protein [Cytophagales bacterium]